MQCLTLKSCLSQVRHISRAVTSRPVPCVRQESVALLWNGDHQGLVDRTPGGICHGTHCSKIPALLASGPLQQLPLCKGPLTDDGSLEIRICQSVESQKMCWSFGSTTYSTNIECLIYMLQNHWAVKHHQSPSFVS